MPHTAGHRRARGRVVHRRHVHRGAYGDFVFRRFRDRRLPWGWSRDSVKRSGAPSSTTERESASILMTVCRPIAVTEAETTALLPPSLSTERTWNS